MSFEKRSHEEHIMDDSMINSILLPSSIHLENLERLIKNLEQQTFNVEDVFIKDNNQDLLDKSYTSNLIPIDNEFDENFLVKSLTLKNNSMITDHVHESISIDSLSTQRDNEKLLKINNQSLSNDHDSGFTWDEQYDTQTNYSIAFNNDKSQETDSKFEKISNGPVNTINDWSMKSDLNTIEQPINPSEKIPCSSTSWRQMKQNQRTTTPERNTQESPKLSPINLYKIFQQKINTITTSSRSAFQLYRPQNDLTNSNRTTIEKSKSIEDHSNIDPSLNHQYPLTSPIGSKSKSYDNLNEPYPNCLFSTNKSLPDLSFIAQYSKELPVSPKSRNSALSINVARTTSSPTLIQHQKHESDRPRTLKSIKRYKNSKHSTEPLGVFCNSQVRNNATMNKTKLPSTSSLQTEQQTNNVKSHLRYQSRANSCDIQATLIDNQDLHDPLLKYQRSNTETIQSSENIHYPNQQDNRLREHHSQYDLPLLIEQINQTKKSVSYSGNISNNIQLSGNKTVIFNENKEQTTKRPIIRHDEMRRCQTDIIHIDPLFHRYTFNDSPPNEFCLQADDEILMEEFPIDMKPNFTKPIEESTMVSSMNSIKIDLLETITDVIKQILEIKQNEKSFFLNNENNLQLDSLLKSDFCTAIQNILEHGRKDYKKITLWKIIEMSMNPTNSFSDPSRPVPDSYNEAKTMAQNVSSNWLYKFQAFIFFLLNKNELINWLYYFTRQKDVLQYYYQSPDALVLVSIPTTFNLFERIMTQLEKLTPLPFQLTYRISLSNDNQLNTSMISMNSTKSNPRNWLISISRRTPKTLTQSIVQSTSNDSFRSSLTKKLNTLFTRTTPQEQRRSSSVVIKKLPEQNQDLNDINTNDSIVPNSPISIKSSGIISTFQSKISRPSLNIDTPKSSRYHTTVTFPK